MLSPLGLVCRGVEETASAAVLARAGWAGFEPPHRTLGAAAGFARHGTIGGVVAAAAARHGDRTAIVDERGALSWREVHERSSALAVALQQRGIEAGDGVALLARNHRGFVEALFAAAKLGARVVLLNTDFAGPQIADVAQREGARLLICDEEYVRLLDDARFELGVLHADDLEAPIAQNAGRAPARPGQGADVVILTSGTTGTPKGAARGRSSSLRSLAPAAGLLEKIPYRSRQTMVLGAPLFHGLGLGHLFAAAGLGDTLVMRRRFDAEAMLDDLARHRAEVAVLVPVMLRRLLALGPEAIAQRDLAHLRIVFLGGSQLSAELATRATDALGPKLYNLYGSTEVAVATIATPQELALAPGSVGSPPRGHRVRILDDAGLPLPDGQVGRIFVANGMAFEGYTGGGGKEVVDGLMATGDVGHFDPHGLLHVDGRDDDMIVSGAENVFPAEVEELLATHPAVVEAAVVGVPDDEFGQRLAAYVVADDGLGADDVRDHVRAHLARFKVPRDVVFVDELPRNPTGKVLKRSLPDAPARR